jgi:predicted RND superfamily exporter protein
MNTVAWYRIGIFVACLLIWPFVAIGAKQAWDNNRNRIEDWLPESFAETQQLIRFFEKFGSDELLMIGWEECDLEAQLPTLLIEKLVSPDSDGTQWFATAFSGATMLEQLQAPPHNLTRQQALARLRGILIGPDLDQTAVVALVSPAGLADRHGAVAHARQASQSVTGLPSEQIHIAGPTLDSVVIDETSVASLLELNLVSFAFILFLLAIILRNTLLTATLFLTAVFNEQIALAMVHYSGGKMDSLLLLMANLAFVLTVSSGLHGLSYYREAIAAQHPYPRNFAFRRAFLPTSLAALTTSIGFASLCVSQIRPIVQFGYYSAIIVPWSMFSALALMILWAGVRLPWAHTQKNALRTRPASAENPVHPNTDDIPGRGFSYAQLLHRINPLVLITWLLLSIGGTYYLQTLQTAIGTKELLDPDTKMLRDYQWLEDRIGPLVPVEFVVHFPAADERSYVDKLLLLGRLSRSLSEIPDVGVRWSALNVIPPLPSGSGLRGEVRKNVANAQIQNALPGLSTLRLVHTSETGEYWRISARVSGSSPPPFAELIPHLSAWIAKELSVSENAGITIDMSGGVPVTYMAQRQLLKDLILSFLTAFLLIAAVMCLMLRSIPAGLLATLPNAIPAILVFGGMSFLGIAVELGAMLTASAAMGVAADNTLHLIHHFRHAFRHHGDAVRAAGTAISLCAAPIVQTTFVCALGMAVFALSPFVPTARFAWLMVSLLSVGLLADLSLTPTFLVSRFSRVFQPKPRQNPDSEIAP